MALAAFVALQHFGFFVLETFLWQKPLGRRVFRLTPEAALITAPLAKNQGVYNSFLAAGLVWGLMIALGGGWGSIERGRVLLLFFLGCVVIAGLVGGMTVNRRIFWIQGLPALIAFELLLFAGKQ